MFTFSLNESYGILSRQNINVDAEITLVVPSDIDNDRYDYDVYEIYNPRSERDGLNVTRMGHWSKLTGLVIQLNEQTKTERRRNFRGLTFTSVVTLRNIPENVTFLEHLQSNDYPYVNNLGRINYRLFTLIEDIYNLKVQVRVAEFYAHLDASHNWHGAIDLVKRRKVDFGLTPLRWEDDRYGVVEHTTHSYHAQILFIFRHPKSIPSNAFTLPFRSNLWYAIVVLVVCSACIIWNIFSVENHKKVKSALHVKRANEDTFSNSILMMIGFIFQQGYSGNIVLTSSRILVVAVLAFALLVYQFYSSFIVGSLLIEAPKNIKTMKQLLNSPLSFGQDEQPYVINNFQYAQEESTVLLYKKIMEHPERTIMPAGTGLKLLKNGGFAFNTDGLLICLNQPIKA
ncbi:uncharacterized protein LOC119075564, partial [Bradysia coprophila]|uniref:uncharacterized protein LOC119075564 n=1 Tax=Bradysia coprophila TaxID=38358 RepID=UPI00187DBC30